MISPRAVTSAAIDEYQEHRGDLGSSRSVLLTLLLDSTYYCEPATTD